MSAFKNGSQWGFSKGLQQLFMSFMTLLNSLCSTWTVVVWTHLQTWHTAQEQKTGWHSWSSASWGRGRRRRQQGWWRRGGKRGQKRREEDWGGRTGGQWRLRGLSRYWNFLFAWMTGGRCYCGGKHFFKLHHVDVTTETQLSDNDADRTQDLILVTDSRAEVRKQCGDVCVSLPQS